MERTVVLIKPDGMQKKIVGTIIDRFEREGLQLIGLKLINLTQEMLETWYAHHKDKPFFKDLSEFMKKTPVVAMVLKSPNAVNRVREVIGPTDSTKAPKGTIRGDLGTDNILDANREGRPVYNLIHASGSKEEAEKEINLWFGQE